MEKKKEMLFLAEEAPAGVEKIMGKDSPFLFSF